MKPSDIRTGMRFSRLVTISQAGWTSTRWKCRCDCGTEKFIESSSLVRGSTKSCGCLLKDLAAARRKPNTPKDHPFYAIWQGIRTRCDPANKHKREFRRYAGRGISMCAEWRDDFWAFARHIGPRPSPTHSIDRIDNDGNYEPGNVRWATRGLQRRNCIAIHPLEIRGQTLCVMDWAKQSGIGVQTVYRRLQRGWDAEQAVFHIGWARVDRENVRR